MEGTATIEYDPALTTPEQIVASFNSQSFYRASLPGANRPSGVPDRPLGWLPYLLAAVTLVLLIIGVRHRYSSRGR